MNQLRRSAALLFALGPFACASPAPHDPLVAAVGRTRSRAPFAPRAAPWSLRAPAECAARVFGGHNYFFCPGQRPLDGARDYCHAFGAELAVIGGRYENDALADAARALDRGRHLIGHHDRVTVGGFETVDGSPMTFSAWAAGEPNNLGDEDCAELDGSSVWNDVPCNGIPPNVLCEESAPCTVEFFGDHLYHLCEAPPAASPRRYCAGLGAAVATADNEAEERFLAEHGRGASALVCETGAPCVRRFHEGRMFLFCLRSGTTATDARAACVGLGGALAVIDDAATNAFVYAQFAPMRRTHFYVDLRDDNTEGVFYSRTGPARFTAWAPGEPNNQGDEDCVELADAGWNDVPCAGDTKNAFVCEMPPGPGG